MGTFFAYSLQSAICLTAFYLFFKVLLSRDTFHRFNRIALLGILALSLIIPLTAVLLLSNQTTEEYGIISEINKEALIGTEEVENKKVNIIEEGSIYLSWLLLAYLVGCTALLVYTIISLGNIIGIIHKGKRINTDNGTIIIIPKNKNTHPFSWMNYVIISQDDYDEAGETIITHEKAHSSLGHTYDLIIAQMCIITQWFNPTIWLLYQELQNIHEYEADERVLRQGIDARQYQLLLIKKAVGTRLYSMANSFSHSNLKKRITMMLQKKSNSWARLKYTYVLPLAAITVTALAHPEISKQFEEISNAKISHFALETSANEVKNLPEVLTPGLPATLPKAESLNRGDSVHWEVEHMPEFPGGDAALLEYIANSIKYPEGMSKESVLGRVNCQFVVEKDGSVSDVEVVRSINPALDKEAIRVIKTIPKFTPARHKGEVVRVKYAVPVRFGAKPPQAPQAAQKPQKSQTSLNDPTLYITAEDMPRFPGGDAGLLKYIADQIVYPKNAEEEGIQGRVNCQFIVEKDGSVSNAVVVRPFHPELDKEAIRVLSALPKFIPGKDKGEIVRVKYSVPVRFSLEKAKKE